MLALALSLCPNHSHIPLSRIAQIQLQCPLYPPLFHSFCSSFLHIELIKFFSLLDIILSQYFSEIIHLQAPEYTFKWLWEVESEPAIKPVSQEHTQEKTCHCFVSDAVSWPYLPATNVVRAWRCQACWGLMCLEEGRQAGWLTNWFAGRLLVWTVPVSRSSRAFGPELGTAPLAGSLSTRQRAAGLAQQLSGEKVCVFIVFPAAVGDTRVVEGGQGPNICAWVR